MNMSICSNGLISKNISAIEHLYTNTILWANGEILDFSSIEHFFVHLH